MPGPDTARDGRCGSCVFRCWLWRAALRRCKACAAGRFGNLAGAPCATRDGTEGPCKDVRSRRHRRDGALDSTRFTGRATRDSRASARFDLIAFTLERWPAGQGLEVKCFEVARRFLPNHTDYELA